MEVELYWLTGRFLGSLKGTEPERVLVVLRLVKRTLATVVSAWVEKINLRVAVFLVWK